MDATPAGVTCLLLEVPFRSVDLPNVGLSLVKQGAVDRGHSCEIRYENLAFAKMIGEGLYATVSEHLPQECLVGEIVFAPHVWGRTTSVETLSNLRPARSENRATGIPTSIVRSLPRLQRVAGFFIEQVVDRILRAQPAVVGFSTTFFRLPSLAVARALKEAAPSIKVVLGGANCEGEMGVATLRNFNFVDFVLRGEADQSLADLLDAGETPRTSLRSIKGLIWRDNGQICWNSPGEPNANLDALPVVSYADWFEERRVSGYVIDPIRTSLPLETSRGCWFGEKSHCIFCGLNGESLASRAKSAERVLVELEGLQSYGVTNIFATDLIFPNAYFKTLLPELAKRDFGFSIYYEIKSNLTRDRLKLLRAAGIDRLQPGIESLDTATLKIMRKGVSGYQNLRLLKWCAELSINVFWNILIGTPGELPESLRKTRDLISKIVHLRPPIDGCVRIRVDRFSPMFNKPGSFGFRKLDPSPAYFVAYPLPEEEVRALAYHFVGDESGSGDSEEYEAAAQDLMDAVHEWHGAAGSTSLVLLHHESGTFVSDRRSAAALVVKLEPIETTIMMLAEGGAPRERVLKEIGERGAAGAIDRLLDLSFICEVDGLLLSLATVFDAPQLIRDLSPEDSLRVAHVVHCGRIRRACEPYKLQLGGRETGVDAEQRPAIS